MATGLEKKEKEKTHEMVSLCILNQTCFPFISQLNWGLGDVDKFSWDEEINTQPSIEHITDNNYKKNISMVKLRGIITCM